MKIGIRGFGLLCILLAGVLDFAANWLAAHELLTFGTFLVPAGTFLFALAFVVYDLLRRVYGLRYTLAAVLLGFFASAAYALAFGGSIGRIAVAGLIALACSSTADLLMQTVTLRWPISQCFEALTGTVPTRPGMGSRPILSEWKFCEWFGFMAVSAFFHSARVQQVRWAPL